MNTFKRLFRFTSTPLAPVAEPLIAGGACLAGSIYLMTLIFGWGEWWVILADRLSNGSSLYSGQRYFSTPLYPMILSAFVRLNAQPGDAARLSGAVSASLYAASCAYWYWASYYRYKTSTPLNIGRIAMLFVAALAPFSTSFMRPDDYHTLSLAIIVCLSAEIFSLSMLAQTGARFNEASFKRSSLFRLGRIGMLCGAYFCSRYYDGSIVLGASWATCLYALGLRHALRMSLLVFTSFAVTIGAILMAGAVTMESIDINYMVPSIADAVTAKAPSSLKLLVSMYAANTLDFTTARMGSIVSQILPCIGFAIVACILSTLPWASRLLIFNFQTGQGSSAITLSLKGLLSRIFYILIFGSALFLFYYSQASLSSVLLHLTYVLLAALLLLALFGSNRLSIRGRALMVAGLFSLLSQLSQIPSGGGYLGYSMVLHILPIGLFMLQDKRRSQGALT